MKERVLERARKVNLEAFAKRLIDEGRNEEFITDALIWEAARRGYAAGSGKSLDEIDDETFVRGLTNPNHVDLE